MIPSRLAIGDDRPEFTKYLWNVKQLNYEWDGMEVFLMAHLFQDSSQIFVWMLIDVDRPWMGACVSRQPDHRSPFGLVEKECIRTVRLIIVFSPKPLYFTGIPVSLMFIRTKSLASEFWVISPHHHSLVQVLQSVQVDLKLGCLSQQHPTSSGWPSWFSGTNTFVKHWLM